MSEPQTKNEGGKFPRRNFIDPRFWLGTLAGTYVGLKSLEAAMYKSISLTIENPNISDDLTRELLELSAKAPNSENPNFRPMADIITEGNNLFEQKTGRKVFFKRIEGYKESELYNEVLQEFSSPSLLIKNPEKLIVNIKQNLPDKARDIYAQSSYVIGSFREIYSNGNGFMERFKGRHPEQLHPTGMFTDANKTLGTMEEEGKQELIEVKKIIENEVTKSGIPISASFIYEYFLEKNNGDMALSLSDTTIALKFLARNDFETGLHTVDLTKVDWYKQKIEDEYQGPSYINVPEGESGVNLIGKVYHGWNLVTLLQFVPVEIIRLGGIQKQLSTFNEQGLAKTRADLQTLSDLRQTENLLLSYPQA